jgi:hypothetical protein
MPTDTNAVVLLCLVGALAMDLVAYCAWRYVRIGHEPIFVRRRRALADIRAAIAPRLVELERETNHIMETHRAAAQ